MESKSLAPASTAAAVSKAPVSATAAVVAGLAGLAAAMGIGRFSFTPLLPLMQQDAGVTLAQGSWLATANYIGYLAGALVCIAAPPAPRRAIQWGLAVIALTTGAMGLTGAMEHAHALGLWLALRFVAGAASAFVLVGVSAWAMPILTQLGRAAWSGRVFSGVGVGICFAGLIGLAAGVYAWGSQMTWLILGGVALLVTALLWPVLAASGQSVQAARVAAAPLSGQAWLAALCYGAFGYGYIIPATFLPALARSAIANPAVFGWVWPVFGAAAAVSTVLVARLARGITPRQLWARAQWVLAAGVLAPVFAVNLYTLLLAALCVGGTFMVITMAGIQEARRLGGAQAPRLIAVYTAAFAAGQIIGPLTVGMFHGGGLALPSMLAAAALAASSLTLTFSGRAAANI